MWISKWHKLFTLRNSLRNEQQAGEIADRVLILCRVWTSAHLWVDGHFWLLKIQISGKNESKLGRDFKEILSFLFSLFCGVGGAWARGHSLTPCERQPVLCSEGSFLSVELPEIHSISKTLLRALPLWGTPVRTQNLGGRKPNIYQTRIAWMHLH